MKTELRITIHFADRDFISSLVHYGIRINSTWIGYSCKFNKSDELARAEKIRKLGDWVEVNRNA